MSELQLQHFLGLHCIHPDSGPGLVNAELELLQPRRDSLLEPESARKYGDRAPVVEDVSQPLEMAVGLAE